MKAMIMTMMMTGRQKDDDDDDDDVALHINAEWAAKGATVPPVSSMAVRSLFKDSS